MTEHAEGFTEDDVRKRAHEISLRPDAGTADEPTACRFRLRAGRQPDCTSD